MATLVNMPLITLYCTSVMSRWSGDNGKAGDSMDAEIGACVTLNLKKACRSLTDGGICGFGEPRRIGKEVSNGKSTPREVLPWARIVGGVSPGVLTALGRLALGTSGADGRVEQVNNPDDIWVDL